MKMSSLSMHPSDETLSRVADQSEVERMRSRAGRHVVRCERCRSEVAAIAALGEAVRAIPDAPLPASLGARIAERRWTDSTIAASLAAAAPLGGASADLRRHWSTKKRSTVAAAAAAVILAVLAAPAWRRHVLAAAAPGQATMSPRYPKPGAAVALSFVPAPDWVGGDRLWVGGLIDVGYEAGGVRRLGPVPVGVLLLRERDGAYRGRFVMPPATLSGALRIMTDSVPGPRNRGVATLLVLSGDASGARPSLEAMESAVYNRRSFMAEKPLADAFARWAPAHPMRWLVDVSRARRGPFDWLRYFSSAEGRFARLTDQLNARRDVRAGELAGMAGLAYALEEPEFAAQWTERLVREHPDDPWTIDLRAREIHEMELRGAPEDSIARLLPSLDTLFLRAHGRVSDMYSVASLVANHGDSAMKRRWSLRSARAGRYFPGEFKGRQQIFSDPEMQDSVEAFARETLAGATTPPLWNPYNYMVDPRIERARAYSTLASLALARRQYRAAVALSDSARVSDCLWMGRDTRALALLALGDTAAAVPDLAVFGKNGIMLTPDSARSLLGSRFDPQRWQRAVDSADAVRQACRRQAR